MANVNPPVKAQAFDLSASLYTSTGLITNPGTLTLKISKDFGDWADSHNSGSTPTDEDSTYGQIKIALDTTDMNADVVDVYLIDNTSGCIPFKATIYTCSATRGLAGTALPAAAADAAGGIPISDAGGLDLDVKLANTNEITAARMGALTDWINGGRLDLLLDSLVAAIITNAAGDDVAADIIALKAVADAITAAVITNAAGADVSADVIAMKAVADAIKVITDQITFTTIGANKRINSTVKAVVSTELTGDGSTTPWGPA